MSIFCTLPSVNQALTEALSCELGSEVRTQSRVFGGDINEAYCIELADGRKAFVKTHRKPPTGMFIAEAQGLRLLRTANSTLAIPEVWAASEAKGEQPAFLVTSWLEKSRASSEYESDLGAGLAALHRSAPPDSRFGLAQHNYLALLAQDNTRTLNWPTFYAQQRLEPMVARAQTRGTLPSATARACRNLYPRLGELLASNEPPALLHGDLWAGNAMATTTGPAIFDPAVYYGHREIDLAMMHLFGGFSARTFAAYQEAYPLVQGHEDRRPLYQLYPLLVHVNLFGAGYVAQVADVLRQYA